MTNTSNIYNISDLINISIQLDYPDEILQPQQWLTLNSDNVDNQNNESNQIFYDDNIFPQKPHEIISQLPIIIAEENNNQSSSAAEYPVNSEINSTNSINDIPISSSVKRKGFRIEVKKKLICDACKKPFSSKACLQQHLSSHSTEHSFKCKKCEKTFKYKSALFAHQATHKGKTKCNICKRKFANKPALKIHINSYRPMNNSHKFICCYARCRVKYRTDCESDFEKHLLEHRNSKVYKCDLCNMQYLSQSGLYTHIKIHMDGNQYKCRICNETFTTPARRRTHENKHRETIVPSARENS